MHYELSKREKKIARVCIEKGLEAEFCEAMQIFDTILRDWRSGKFATNKEAYHQLFKAVGKKDNAIARRYDGLTGSQWLVTVAAILRDGYISAEDIEDFSDETKSIIERWVNL